MLWSNAKIWNKKKNQSENEKVLRKRLNGWEFILILNRINEIMRSNHHCTFSHINTGRSKNKKQIEENLEIWVLRRREFEVLESKTNRLHGRWCWWVRVCVVLFFLVLSVGPWRLSLPVHLRKGPSPICVIYKIPNVGPEFRWNF